MPILPETEVLRGDILTRRQHPPYRRSRRRARLCRSSTRGDRSDDCRRRDCGCRAGRRPGVNWGAIPIGLSTSGGALLAGLLLGFLRAIRPTFGRIPPSALTLMNTLGLNVFIAIVGINAGPGFVTGLQQVGVSLFIWGIVATSRPLVIAICSVITCSSSTRRFSSARAPAYGRQPPRWG